MAQSNPNNPNPTNPRLMAAWQLFSGLVYQQGLDRDPGFASCFSTMQNYWLNQAQQQLWGGAGMMRTTPTTSRATSAPPARRRTASASSGPAANPLNKAIVDLVQTYGGPADITYIRNGVRQLGRTPAQIGTTLTYLVNQGYLARDPSNKNIYSFRKPWPANIAELGPQRQRRATTTRGGQRGRRPAAAAAE